MRFESIGLHQCCCNIIIIITNKAIYQPKFCVIRWTKKKKYIIAEKQIIFAPLLLKLNLKFLRKFYEETKEWRKV